MKRYYVVEVLQRDFLSLQELIKQYLHERLCFNVIIGTAG